MMDCLKAQTRITSYVEGDLQDEEIKEFLLHMKNCPSCKEELEIYYTLMEATRQLDEGVLTTSDFMAELEEKIDRELTVIRKRETLDRRAKFVVFVLFFCGSVLAAVNLFDLPVPWAQPDETTWEMQKEHINESMIPYMYQLSKESPYPCHISEHIILEEQ